MRHPREGTLRRLVDEPVGVADADRAHVAGCPECLTTLAAVQHDAAAARDALATDDQPDVDAAWRRLDQHLDRGSPRAATPTAAARWRTAVRSPAVAFLGVVAILAGASAAAAADWLQIFRTEEIVPITISQADLVGLPDLSSFGDLEFTQRPQIREVDDAAAAAEATGLVIPRVTQLPRGVDGEPTFQVGGQVSAVFTFDAEEAGRLAADVGEALPPPPPGLDGSRIRVVAGPSVAEVWAGAGDVPVMVVARAVAPTAYSSGISFEQARDYLLSLPGLPDNVASQLRSLSGDGSTLPLPLPAEAVRAEDTEVDGVPARLLTSRDGTMAAVVWVDEGVVTVIAGALDDDEVLSVARGLTQW